VIVMAETSALTGSRLRAGHSRRGGILFRVDRSAPLAATVAAAPLRTATVAYVAETPPIQLPSGVKSAAFKGTSLGMPANAGTMQRAAACQGLACDRKRAQGTPLV
jgi:hypothetical protein